MRQQSVRQTVGPVQRRELLHGGIGIDVQQRQGVIPAVPGEEGRVALTVGHVECPAEGFDPVVAEECGAAVLQAVVRHLRSRALQRKYGLGLGEKGVDVPGEDDRRRFGRPGRLLVTSEIGRAVSVELAHLLDREALVVPDEPGEDVGRLLEGAVVPQRDLDLGQPDAAPGDAVVVTDDLRRLARRRRCAAGPVAACPRSARPADGAGRRRPPARPRPG